LGGVTRGLCLTHSVGDWDLHSPGTTSGWVLYPSSCWDSFPTTRDHPRLHLVGVVISRNRKASPSVTPLERGIREGYRSGLEERVSAQLEELGIPFEYEKYTLKYLPQQKFKRYTFDYLLLDNGIIIETKGRFVSSDRTKHKDVKVAFPELDIRFVFSNPNTRIGKKSSTTYAMWCDRFGFKYAKGDIPSEWFQEPRNDKALEILEQFKKSN